MTVTILMIHSPCNQAIKEAEDETCQMSLFVTEKN